MKTKRTLKPAIGAAVKEWFKSASPKELQEFCDDANAFAEKLRDKSEPDCKPVMTSVFRYRCRRCGKISDGCECDKDIGDRTLAFMAVTGRDDINDGGMRVRMMMTCSCDDGGRGLSDLIGYEIRSDEIRRKEGTK